MTQDLRETGKDDASPTPAEEGPRLLAGGDGPAPSPSEDVAAATATRLCWLTLLLVAVGHLYDNVAVFWLAGFPVIIPQLLLGATAGLAWFTHRRSAGDHALPVICGLVISWQLLVGLLLGLVGEVQWLRSMSLLLYSVACFALASRLQLTRRDIVETIPLLLKITLVFGGLGMLQFLLLNGLGVQATVPSPWSVSQWDPSVDVFRTGRLQRAGGLSTEPSMYALGLSIVTAMLLFFNQVKRFSHEWLARCAAVALVGGAILSFSLTGWSIALGAVATAIATGGIRLSMRSRLLIACLLLLALLIVLQGWFPPVTGRLRSLADGSDRSANVRVVAATQLLFAAPRDLGDLLAGRGLGMADRYRDLMEPIYGRFGIHGTDIHSLFAYIRVTGGWVAVLLHVALLVAVFHPLRRKDWPLWAPLLVTVLLLHFATGHYFHPAFWAVLALVRVLRNVQ